ncbi:MAG: SDR family NAD(P)-dependent oxidoreductase [Bacteroidota bacterium]
MNLEEKYVLITGGTSGIGYELAKLFADDDYNLVLVARDKAELARVKAEIEDSSDVIVITIAKDLFDYDNAFEVYNELKQKEIPVGILVNNAGHGYYGELKDTDIRKQLGIIRLNICSLVVLTKLFLDDMLAAGEGKILNLSSIASKTPGPWHSVYHATKAFVQSFTEAVREEVKDKGVTVTALLPGVTNTDFFRKAGMEISKEAQDLEKMSDPADVAKDGYSALMTGKDMVVSGFKNKMGVFLNKFHSDECNAEKMGNRQEPVDEDDKEKRE